MQYALVAPRTQILLAPPCGGKREPQHYHCTEDHVGFTTLAEVQHHLDAGCPLVYLCPLHGQELPYDGTVGAPGGHTDAQDATRGGSLLSTLTQRWLGPGDRDRLHTVEASQLAALGAGISEDHWLGTHLLRLLAEGGDRGVGALARDQGAPLERVALAVAKLTKGGALDIVGDQLHVTDRGRDALTQLEVVAFPVPAWSWSESA